MKFKNPQAAAVRSAWSTLAKAKEKVERVEKTLRSIVIPEIDEAAVLRSRERVEDLLASRALGDASDAEEQQAKAALRIAQSAFEQSKSARSEKALERDGLSRHLAVARGALTNAENSFKEVQRAWAFEELQAADLAYTEAVAEVVKHFRRARSCGKLMYRLTGEDYGPYKLHASSDIKLPVIGPASKEVSVRLQVSDGYFDPGIFLCAERYAMQSTDVDELVRELALLR